MRTDTLPPMITGAVQPGTTVTVRTWPRSPMARAANDDDPHIDRVFAIGTVETSEQQSLFRRIQIRLNRILEKAGLKSAPPTDSNVEHLPWNDLWARTMYGRRTGARFYLPIEECNGVESVILKVA